MLLKRADGGWRWGGGGWAPLPRQRRSGRHKPLTRRSPRREGRVTVRGLVKRPQPNERSHGGGGWHKASVSDCLPVVAPIGLSPLPMPTLCGPERVLVVSTEPLFDYSGGRLSRRRAVARAVHQVHPDVHSESMLRLATPALTCARWGASAGQFS